MIKKIVEIAIFTSLLCLPVFGDAPNSQSIPVHVDKIYATSDVNKFIISVIEDGSSVDKILDLNEQKFYEKKSEMAIDLQQPVEYIRPNNLTDEIKYDQISHNYYWSLINNTILISNNTIPSLNNDNLIYREFFASTVLNRSYLFLEYSQYREVLILPFQSNSIVYRTNLSDLGFVSSLIPKDDLKVYAQINLMIWGSKPIPDIGGPLFILKYNSTSIQKVTSLNKQYAAMIFDPRTDSILHIEENHVTYINYLNLTKVEFTLHFTQSSSLFFHSEIMFQSLLFLVYIKYLKKLKIKKFTL